MYEQIENILVRTISPYEYEQLELLKTRYNEQQIVNAYKNSSIKNINYIKKILQSKLKNVPEWATKEIINEPIDKETEDLFNDFNNFINEYRN